jgi:hypothetical protein
MSMRVLVMRVVLATTFLAGMLAIAAPTPGDPTRILVIRAAKGSETALTTVIDPLFDLACQKLVPTRYAAVVKYGDDVDPGLTGKDLPPDPLNAPLDILDQQIRSVLANTLLDRCGAPTGSDNRDFDALVVKVIDKANRNVNLSLRFISTPVPPARGTRIEKKWNSTGLDNFDSQHLASFVDCVGWAVWKVPGSAGEIKCSLWGLPDPSPPQDQQATPVAAIVEQPAAQPIQFRTDVQPPASGSWPAWVLTSAGGVGLGVGFVSSLLVGHYQSKVGSFVGACRLGMNTCEGTMVRRWEERARTAENWQWSYAVGGALLTAGAFYLLKERWFK